MLSNGYSLKNENDESNAVVQKTQCEMLPFKNVNLKLASSHQVFIDQLVIRNLSVIHQSAGSHQMVIKISSFIRQSSVDHNS